jgi:hypothetical protein
MHVKLRSLLVKIVHAKNEREAAAKQHAFTFQRDDDSDDDDVNAPRPSNGQVFNKTKSLCCTIIVVSLIKRHVQRGEETHSKRLLVEQWTRRILERDVPTSNLIPPSLFSRCACGVSLSLSLFLHKLTVGTRASECPS